MNGTLPAQKNALMLGEAMNCHQLSLLLNPRIHQIAISWIWEHGGLSSVLWRGSKQRTLDGHCALMNCVQRSDLHGKNGSKTTKLSPIFFNISS